MSMFTRTPASDEHPLGEVYDWVRNLPPTASVHVRTREGYVGRFDADEIQDTVPVEEFLLSEYGPDTYQLSAHAEGVFLAGKHTVAVGSRRHREEARRSPREAPDEPQDVLRDMGRLVEIMRSTGAIQDPQPIDVALLRELYQARLEAAQKVDSSEAMNSTIGLIERMRKMDREGARQRASSSRPHRSESRTRRRPNGRKRSRSRGRASSSSEGSSRASSAWTPFLMGVTGAAVTSGMEYAFRNPEKVKSAVGRVANGAGEFFQTRFSRQGPPAQPSTNATDVTAAGPEPASTPPGGFRTAPGASEASRTTLQSRFKTLEELFDLGRIVAKDPFGQRLIASAKQVIPTLSPREIAERGLEKARGWLGDHPLLKELERDPETAFEEVADLVGLEGETRAQVKQALYAILGVGEAPTADSSEQATGEGQAS